MQGERHGREHLSPKEMHSRSEGGETYAPGGVFRSGKVLLPDHGVLLPLHRTCLGRIGRRERGRNIVKSSIHRRSSETGQNPNPCGIIGLPGRRRPAAGRKRGGCGEPLIGMSEKPTVPTPSVCKARPTHLQSVTSPKMFGLPKKHEKLASILILAGSLLLSFGILLIPIDYKGLAALGYVGVFLVTLIGATTLFLPAPTAVAVFAVASVLNPVLTSVVAGLGSAIGESTGYMSGYASLALVESKERRNAWYWKVLEWMHDYPFVTLFLLSAIPNFLTDLAGLVAGRMKYPYPRYLVATFFGKTIRFGLIAYLGTEFGSLLPWRS
jgi:membrane protein YqaA with SNARE-associated domain